MATSLAGEEKASYTKKEIKMLFSDPNSRRKKGSGSSKKRASAPRNVGPRREIRPIINSKTSEEDEVFIPYMSPEESRRLLETSPSKLLASIKERGQNNSKWASTSAVTAARLESTGAILDKLGITEVDVDFSVKDIDQDFDLKCGPEDDFWADLRLLNTSIENYNKQKLD